MTDDLARITNLLGRYCHLVDDEPIERVAELFWDDAKLLAAEGKEYDGIDRIVAWYREWDATMRAPVTELRHRLTSPCIELDGDRASARSYVDADAVVKGAIIGIRGRYIDTLERRAGEWRFAHRTIVVLTPPPRTTAR